MHVFQRDFTQRQASGQTQGAASSAAKANQRVGFNGYSDRVWVRGEGWVKWTEIQAQVDRAFRRCQAKWAERAERALQRMTHAA